MGKQNAGVHTRSLRGKVAFPLRLHGFEIFIEDPAWWRGILVKKGDNTRMNV